MTGRDFADFSQGRGNDELVASLDYLPAETDTASDDLKPSQERTDKLPDLRLIDPTEWEGTTVPESEWIVPNFVPAKTVSLLAGEGGVGKSILVQQLAVARATKRQWLSTTPRPGRTIVLSAEDDTDEMHRRLDAICAHYGVRFSDLGDMRLIDLVGADSVLGTTGKTGIVSATKLFETVCQAIKGFSADLVVVDALADVFAGDENKRGEARQFMSMLKRPCRDYGCAFLAVAHPSLTGINNNTGSSGSTAWGNSVRSRMFFEHARASDGSAPDPDMRTLTVNKSNYGPRGGAITLKWQRGVYVVVNGPNSLDKRAMENRADNVFLELLSMHNTQGQDVSAKPGPTYAPTRFASHPNANGIGKRHFEAAMQRHLASQRISIETFGPASKRRSKLVVNDTALAQADA